MITSTTTATGRFRIEKYRGSVLVDEVPFFDNVIVRSGFAQILSNNGNASLSAVVGAGTSLPDQNNIALDNEIPGANTCIETNTYREFLPDAYGRLRWRVVYRFRYATGAFGAGSKVLCEVGIKTSSGLVCRTLLKDPEGNPASITLDGATEGIDVVWEYTEYLPESAQVPMLANRRNADGSLIDSVTHTVTVSPANFTSDGSRPLDGWYPVELGELVSCVFEAHRLVFGVGSVGSVLSQPTFTKQDSPDALSVALSSAGTPRNVLTVFFGLDTCNYPEGISCVLLSLGHMQWQAAIAPPIMKQDTQELTMQFSNEMENQL